MTQTVRIQNGKIYTLDGAARMQEVFGMRKETVTTMYTLEDAEKILKWRNRRKRNAKLRKLRQKLLGLLMILAAIITWNPRSVFNTLCMVPVVIGAVVFICFDDILI